MKLRQYQEDILAEARSLMKRGRKSILIQAPTGSGKTALTAHMLKTAAEKNLSSWFLVHRRELVAQSIRTFQKVGVPYGVVAAGFESNHRRPVQICSVQTLRHRAGKLARPSLLVWDEAHHIAAGTWAGIYRDNPGAFHVGLSATPERADGKGLSQWFSEIILGPPVSWLINEGFLAPYKLYAPSQMNLSGVHTRMGDFVRSELASVADRPTITGDAITHYLKFAAGKRAVVFCVSVEHSKHVVAQFQASGIPAAHVDGETDSYERDQSIKRFERGEIRVLANVDLFGEGFDLPAIEVAILLRPTQSLGLYLQQVGRVLRPFPGKQSAIILDHAGNCERHGLPDDDRSWSLADRDSRRGGKNSEGNVSARICPKCFGAQRAGQSPVCAYCGHVFEVQGREVAEVEGELVEVDKEALKRKRAIEQGAAQTLEELIEIGRKRGYKRPALWAQHIFQARQAKKLAKGRVR